MALWATPDVDGPEGRRLLREELTDPVYSQEPSLLERAITWFMEQLSRLELTGAALSPSWATIALVAGLVAVVVLALVLAGPVRRVRRGARSSVEVLGDDTRTAAQLRDTADRLAADGRWSEAVLDRFRAVLRSLEERAVLEERPGRTAHEAAVEAGPRFPDDASALASVATLFDDVCYGDVEAGEEDDRRVRRLDESLQNRTPAALPGPAQPVAVA